MQYKDRRREKLKTYCHNMIKYRREQKRQSVKDELFREFLALCDEVEGKQKQPEVTPRPFSP